MKRLLKLTFLFVLLGVFQQPLSAQSTQDRFSQTVRIGRGAVQHIEWQPNGQNILADTIRGAWIYQSDGSRLTDVGHIEDARLARFSPDGRTLAGVSEHNTITLWDATAFAQTTSLTGHTAYVRALEWSPDGSKLASADRDGKIFVWDVASAKKVLDLNLTSVDKVAWSRGGRYLATFASQSGAVNVWDAAGKRIFASPHFGSDILWRTDTQLLSRTNDEIPEGPLWDITTGQQVAVVKHGYGTGYNSDGSKLAGSNIGRAWIADGATGMTLSFIDGPQASIVEWSPNDQYIAFGDWSSAIGATTHIRIVEAATAKIVSDTTFEATITEIHWNSDSTGFVIADSASRIFERYLNMPVPQVETIAHTDIGAVAAWRSDGQAIAAADTNYGARLWDASTGQSLIPRMNIGQPASKLAWQPNGTLLATAGGNNWQSLNNNVYVWDTKTPATSAIDPIFVLPHVDIVAGIAWSPDGKTLASAERSQYLRLWKPEEPNVIRVIDLWAIRLAPFIDYTQAISALEWNSSENILDFPYSSSGNGGGVHLVDVDAGAIIPTETPQNFDSTWGWTPDHRFIWANWGFYADAGVAPPTFDITVGGQGITDNAGQPLVLSGLIGLIENGMFSPDARSLIGFDALQQGIIWDIATQTTRVHLSQVNDAIWSPDSTKIAVYKTDGEIEILDGQTGEVLHTFSQHFRTRPAGVATRTQVIWSPDSQKIAMLDSGALFIYEDR